MSNIDLEKDELATQEMMAMLDENQDDQAKAAATEDTELSDMDDLLESIEEVENSTEDEESEDVGSEESHTVDSSSETVASDDASEEDIASEKDSEQDGQNIEATDNSETAPKAESESETELASQKNPDEEPSDELMDAFTEEDSAGIESQEFDSDLDEALHNGLLNASGEAASDNETENTQAITIPPDATEASSVDHNPDTETTKPAHQAGELSEATEPEVERGPLNAEQLDESSDNLHEHDDLDTAQETTQDTEEPSNELSSAPSVDDSLQALAQSETENTAHLSNHEQGSTEQSFANNESEQLNTQLQNALEQMMEAIQVNEKVQEYAKSIESTTIKATHVALATAQKAQTEALQTQATIEASFAAAERAFDSAKETGYQLESEELDKFTETTSSEMEAFLAEIREKNRSLNEANQKLSQRLAVVQTQ